VCACVRKNKMTHVSIPLPCPALTLLGQDSLGGNAKTLMFVNFSPADYNADETVSSLNFATRVKKVRGITRKGPRTCRIIA